VSIKGWILLFFGLTLVSCKKEPEAEVPYRLGGVEKTSKEFVIPRALREHIEQDYLQFLKAQKSALTLSDKDVLDRIPREFLDVTVYFRSSGTGVLVDHTKFELPRGGGEIDLKDYVKGSKGSFYMKVAAQRSSEPEHKVEDLRVYFLSDSKERKIQGEKYGSGCKTFMDVTHFINKENNKEGLQLNAAGQRYLSVIAGTFYFVEFDESRKLYIAAVRISDSRYPELLCDEVR
jgi:hypothetical protein